MTTARVRSWVTIATLATAAVCGGGEARAEAIERGYVVWLEAGEMYFDIGSASGLAAGTLARVKHPVRLQHPVTNQWVSDELPVGTLRVTRVGEALSMAELPGDLLTVVAVGDVVEVLVPRDDPSAPAPVAPVAPPVDDEPLPMVDADTAEVLALWSDNIGRRVDVRITAWERYLQIRGDSPYADAVTRHLTALRALRDRFPPEVRDDDPHVDGLEHDPRTTAMAGERVPLVFAARDSDRISVAWLHYRPRGADTYRRTELRRDGDGYWRGELPSDAVTAPGVEYFAELATHTGEVGAAAGTPNDPIAVDVDDVHATHVFDDPRNRSRITLTTTFLDYATFDDRDGDRTDTYFLFEADFLYRLRTRLYGIRVGLGVLNGEGGFADRADPEAAGFNYAYTELELRGRHHLAYLARLVAGLGDDGLGFGFEGRIRVGDEDKTNLSFGASTLEHIGFLSEIRMQWAAVPQLPLGLAVALTDQPNQGDLGVRLTADIGWRALSWIQPTLRVSYQGRSIQHSGIGGGLGLVFDW